MKVKESVKEKLRKKREEISDFVKRHEETIGHVILLSEAAALGFVVCEIVQKQKAKNSITISKENLPGWWDDLMFMSKYSSRCFTTNEAYVGDDNTTMADIGRVGKDLLDKEIFPKEKVNEDSKIAGTMIFLK